MDFYGTPPGTVVLALFHNAVLDTPGLFWGGVVEFFRVNRPYCPEY
ncbi:hypothetical protein [Arthrobacter sp. PGP41]|nr:hypothetical protein [Arthrobacter sp. PGP41]